MTNYECITISISIISIILAAASAGFTFYSSMKINKFNMRNNYYDLFKDDLTLLIPKYCTDFISEQSQKCNDEVSEEFEKYINNFRGKIKFLNYVDKKNAKKLDNLLIELEEEIIVLPTRTKNIKSHIKRFNYLINKIYIKINKHFS
ncbi:MAG: hypothetical protein PHD02_00950 [Bacilli bacterium]|nr:hypothetical protein [Bacilli bacterium]